MSAEARIKYVIHQRQLGNREPLTKDDVAKYLEELMCFAIHPDNFAAQPDDMHRVDIRDMLQFMLRGFALLASLELSGGTRMSGNVISIGRRVIANSLEQLDDMTTMKDKLIDDDLFVFQKSHLQIAAIHLELARRYNQQMETRNPEKLRAYNVIGNALNALHFGYYDAKDTPKPTG